MDARYTRYARGARATHIASAAQPTRGEVAYVTSVIHPLQVQRSKREEKGVATSVDLLRAAEAELTRERETMQVV